MDEDKTNIQTASRPAKPDPALKRLDVLVGRWKLKGRTLDTAEDNIAGWVIFEWLPGGFFLEARGEINFMGTKIQSLEILGYDPQTHIFPASVYSNMDGNVLQYYWDIRGNTVTHWTEGSKYKSTYDAVMTRVN
jgi:hypothetical protein